MNEDQMLSLREFLGQHWALWEDHCEQRGEDPNEIYVVVLGGEE